MKSVLCLIAILLVGAVNPSPAADTEGGFTTIFDGKTFTGWKTSIDNSHRRARRVPQLNGNTPTTNGSVCA